MAQCGGHFGTRPRIDTPWVGGENGSTRMADPELSPLTGIPIVVPKCSAAACPAGAAFWRAVMKTI
jgi:hypothetical protein